MAASWGASFKMLPASQTSTSITRACNNCSASTGKTNRNMGTKVPGEWGSDEGTGQG